MRVVGAAADPAGAAVEDGAVVLPAGVIVAPAEPFADEFSTSGSAMLMLVSTATMTREFCTSCCSDHFCRFRYTNSRPRNAVIRKAASKTPMPGRSSTLSRRYI